MAVPLDLLLETGDALLLETGDVLLLEEEGLVVAEYGGRFGVAAARRRFADALPSRRFGVSGASRRFAAGGAGMQRAYAELQTLVVGSARRFVFDYSNFPEVVAGETLSAPAITAVSGLTFGSPAVLAAPFVYDEDGSTVATGKGVSVLVTAAAAGDYDVTCLVTASGGGTLPLRDRLKVVA